MYLLLFFSHTQAIFTTRSLDFLFVVRIVTTMASMKLTITTIEVNAWGRIWVSDKAKITIEVNKARG
jgi:hypothetical protein